MSYQRPTIEIVYDGGDSKCWLLLLLLLGCCYMDVHYWYSLRNPTQSAFSTCGVITQGFRRLYFFGVHTVHVIGCNLLVTLTDFPGSTGYRAIDWYHLQSIPAVLGTILDISLDNNGGYDVGR